MCSPTAISLGSATALAPGATTVSPGCPWSLDGAQNIRSRLAHGLHNPSVEILAVHLADRRPRLTLHGHGYRRFERPGIHIRYDIHRADLAERAESVAQGFFAGLR
jgi:hypothetical protein